MVAITKDAVDFGRLYKEHYGLVCRAIARVTKDKELVRDMAQEVFVALPEKIKQYGGISSFRTWLYGVARNYALDYMKKEKKHQEAEPIFGLNGYVRCGEGSSLELEYGSSSYVELEDKGKSPEEMLAYKMRVRRLNEAVQKLEPCEREILELSLRDYSYGEMVELLGVPVNTVKSRLWRARKSLVDLVSV